MSSKTSPRSKRFLNFYFQVHQPRRLKKFQFFDIGLPIAYFNEGLNRGIVKRIAQNCYLPANKLLLDLIKKHPEIRITFSISGTVLEQLMDYAPAVVESFRELANTGAVEFLGETYYHSLAFLSDNDEFIAQVNLHSQKMMQLTGSRPVVFRNTELIYSDTIAETVYDLGFRGMYLDGIERVICGRSPNKLYKHPEVPLVLFPRNYKLSDDIAFRYSDRSWNQWPLTAEKYSTWIEKIADTPTFICLGMDYETLGEHQKANNGIFSFLEEFIVTTVQRKNIRFATAQEAIEQIQVEDLLSSPSVISWADKEKNLSAWLGNDLQQDAFDSLYKMHSRIMDTRNSALIKDYRYLQSADHFYYMSTQEKEDGDVHQYFSPYNSPYEAFMNYMNVLADLEWRIENETKLPKLTGEIRSKDILKTLAKSVSPAPSNY